MAVPTTRLPRATFSRYVPQPVEGGVRWRAKRLTGCLCLCCNHPQRPAIDLAIAMGCSNRQIGERFKISPDAKTTGRAANWPTARVVSLPGDPATLRGFSAPRLIIKDECAYISDEMQAALDPMLAVSGGRLVEMSSPNGRRGHFFENWQRGEDVERIKITGRECPRISAELLERQRRKLGPMLFAQEYDCKFIDARSSAFSSEMIELALVDDFPRFLAA
jgi:hypothetical protein